MKHYFGSRLKILLLRISQAILFAIPLLVFAFVNKDTFFVEKSGYGLAGLGILGVIVWALCLGKVIGKLPKIVFFVILYFAFLSMSLLADYLQQIGAVILIGACLSLPLNYLIHALDVDGNTDLAERSRMKAIKRMKKQKVNVEVGE